MVRSFAILFVPDNHPILCSPVYCLPVPLGKWPLLSGAAPLLQTFVDESRYHGGCYRAANWMPVVLTQGRGRRDRSGQAQGTRKRIFLYPLDPHWRQQLSTETP